MGKDDFSLTHTGVNLNLNTVLLAVNLIAVVTGVGVLWGVQTTRMDDGFKVSGERYAEVRAENAALSTRIAEVEKRNNDDRLVLLSRLVGLEADTKYISQAVSEMKLTLKGK